MQINRSEVNRAQVGAVRPQMTKAEARGYEVGVSACALLLARRLQDCNPRFDRERFLKACGV